MSCKTSLRVEFVSLKAIYNACIFLFDQESVFDALLKFHLTLNIN
jgi:hypothetical protein